MSTIDRIVGKLTNIVKKLENHAGDLDEVYEGNKRSVETLQDMNETLASESERARKIAAKLNALLN